MLSSDINRIYLAQIEVIPGAPAANASQMVAEIAAAGVAGAKLVVFPELAISGRFVGDLWHRDAFITACEAAAVEVCNATRGGVAAAFGNVVRHPCNTTKRLCNGFFIAENGRFCTTDSGVPFIAKSAEHYLDLHFYDARTDPAATFGRPLITSIGAIGAVIGEDALSDSAIALCRKLEGNGATLLLNPCALPFAAEESPAAALAALSTATRLPLCHVNTVGVQDHGKVFFIFSGESGVYHCGERISPAAELCAPAIIHAAVGKEPTSVSCSREVSVDEQRAGRTAHALLHGTGTMLRRLGLQRVVIGLSGGIDSALTALLYSRLIDPADLLLLNLPGPYSSPTTRNLARHLATTLGCRYAEVPITPAVEFTRQQFAELRLNGPGSHSGDRLPLSDYDLENVQARDRGGRVLAAAAAAFGGVISCNTNKTELAIGYGTLYGDICGWLAAIGDLWKGDVYGVARYLNDHICSEPAIPEGIFAVKPSAELSAAQAVDEGRGDPLIYPYHDKLFRAWVERPGGVAEEELVAWYRSGTLAQQLNYNGDVAAIFPDVDALVSDSRRWWRLYQGLAIAKRLQAPPVLAVSRRPFGLHTESQSTPAVYGKPGN
jgi:NAD+ synthase (glutamine-hydrolysing)